MCKISQFCNFNWKFFLYILKKTANQRKTIGIKISVSVLQELKKRTLYQFSLKSSVKILMDLKKTAVFIYYLKKLW